MLVAVVLLDLLAAVDSRLRGNDGLGVGSVREWHGGARGGKCRAGIWRLFLGSCFCARSKSAVLKKALFASLPLCLFASLPLCLFASLPLCLFASLPLCLFALFADVVAFCSPDLFT